MSIQPLADNVLIEPNKKEEQTASGILLPETVNKEMPEKGKVVAVGPGKENSKGVLVPVGVKVGDEVLFSKYGPNEIKIDGKDYLIAKAENILAIIK